MISASCFVMIHVFSGVSPLTFESGYHGDEVNVSVNVNVERTIHRTMKETRVATYFHL